MLSSLFKIPGSINFCLFKLQRKRTVPPASASMLLKFDADMWNGLRGSSNGRPIISRFSIWSRFERVPFPFSLGPRAVKGRRLETAGCLSLRVPTVFGG